MNKVIIQVSINGIDLGHGNKPGSPAEIASDSLDCIRAGASVIHAHCDRIRVSGEEAAERYLEGWRPILTAEPDALLFPTGNWGPDGSVNFDHIEPLARSGALRVAFNDLGSTEIGRIQGPRLHGDHVYGNSFDDAFGRFELYRRLGIGASVHILSLSGLRYVMQLHRAGALPRGCWLNLYFSPEPVQASTWIDGGMFLVLPALPSMLDLCLELIGDSGLPWSATLWGGDLVQSGFGKLVLERGGHLSVGLETYAGDRTPTNATLVREAAQLCRDMGLSAASPAATAELLGLPPRR